MTGHCYRESSKGNLRKPRTSTDSKFTQNTIDIDNTHHILQETTENLYLEAKYDKRKRSRRKMFEIHENFPKWEFR